jgi:P4 family phage/plasmid primase-like protien
VRISAPPRGPPGDPDTRSGHLWAPEHLDHLAVDGIEVPPAGVMLYIDGVKVATTDLEIIYGWIDRWGPSLNLGIALNERHVAVDVDPRNGGDKTLKRLEKERGSLDRSLVSSTGGGGLHIFGASDTSVRTSHGKLGGGIDVQGSGSYVVAPPSRHISGRLYRWQGRGPWGVAKLAVLPTGWLDRPADDPPVSPEAGTTGLNILREGERNKGLASLAGHLRNAGLFHEGLRAALVAENQARCQPPLEADEVDRIAASISTYPALASSPGDDKAEFVMRAVLDRHYANGAHLIHAADQQFWRFDGKRWAPISRAVIEGVILDTIQALSLPRSGTASILKQTVSLLAAKTAVPDDRLRFLAPPEPVLNLVNGELWIASDGNVELRPHRAVSYLRHLLDVSYDPDALCPQYNRVIKEIFSGDKVMVRHWHEIAGYLIQPSRKIPLVLILEGGGGNGKSALMQTIVRLMGSDLVSATKVETLENNRFAIGGLLGKLMLLDDDVKSGAKLPDGLLKVLSEAKLLTGERKYGQPFNFVGLAVPVLLCNGVPSLADLSHGMLRRLMVVRFKEQFENDPTVFERIWGKELPGILNRAVAGLQRVIRRGWRFKHPKALVEAKDRWLTFANPLPAFIEQRCVRDGKCLLRHLYSAYNRWAEEMGITMKQQQLTVRRNLENLGFTVIRSSDGPEVRGLRLKSGV